MKDDLQLLQYLVSKVKRDSNDCWIWQGCLDKDGYGIVGTNTQFGIKYGRGKAHQLSYIAFIGPYPQAALMLHKCHNPQCINPAHLKLGTHADNMKDRSNAGRTYTGKGELNSRAKLKQKDVDFIRANWQDYKTKDLAQKYNVTNATIRAVIRRAIWV